MQNAETWDGQLNIATECPQCKNSRRKCDINGNRGVTGKEL